MSLQPSPLPLSLAPCPSSPASCFPEDYRPRRAVPNAEPEPRAGREAEMELTPTLVGIFPVGFFLSFSHPSALGRWSGDRWGLAPDGKGG